MAVEAGDRFDFVHPDYRREYVVIDPKSIKPAARATNMGVKIAGQAFLSRVGGGTGRGEVAAVMENHLPGSFGRGEFVKA